MTAATSLARSVIGALTGPLAALPRLGRAVVRRRSRDLGTLEAGGLAEALGAAGVWYFELDAERAIRTVFPAPAAVRAALIGRDIRSFIDPLDPLSEHPRLTRAFRGRAPFRDTLMPFNRGEGVRLLRVSGDPVYDRAGAFTGYRGIAIDASTPAPTDAASLIAPDLRHGLVNALGVAIGFAQFLEQDLPPDGAQADYAARIRIAADAARALVLGATPGASREAGPTAGPAAAGPAAHGRVLVVHERPEIADLLSIAFDRAGFEAAVCRDGLEAVDVLAEDPAIWDAVVTSAETPTLGGAALMRRAKALKPAILCVVFDTPDGAAMAQSEADLCWPRPADVVALAQVVKAELALRAPGRG